MRSSRARTPAKAALILLLALSASIPSAQAAPCWFFFSCPEEDTTLAGEPVDPANTDSRRCRFLFFACSEATGSEQVERNRVTHEYFTFYDQVNADDVVGVLQRGQLASTVAFEDEANSWTAPQAFQESATFAANKGLVLTANDPSTGQIRRLVVLKATSPYDRPWVTWLDPEGRNQVSLGYHGTNFVDGARHDAFEVKTSNDPLAPDPTEMRTRFSIGTDKNLTKAIFQWLDMLELNQGPYVVNDPVGLEVRMNDWTGTSRKLAHLVGQVDPGGTTIVSMDPFSMTPGANATQYRMFRSTNTAAAKFVIFAANDSATETFSINAKTGDITRAGVITSYGPTPTFQARADHAGLETTIATIKAFLGQSAESILTVDPVTVAPDKGAHVRHFRNTNTTGAKWLVVYRGDGTNAETFRVNAADGDIERVGNITSTGDISLAPAIENGRAKVLWWNKPGGSGGTAYRPISIEAHGPNDPFSQAYHATVYSTSSDVNDYTQKVLEWYWGPAWEDRLYVHTDLVATQDATVRGTLKGEKNSSATSPTSFPTMLQVENHDQTPGNGATIAFAGQDSGGALREFAAVRATYVDREATSVDGELTFWTSAANTRTQVARADATLWTFNTTGGIDVQENIAFRSGTGTQGILDHAATQPRTWTLPDAAGTLGVKVLPPTASTEPCQESMWAEDDAYLYICTSTDSWKRTALSAW